MEKYSQLFVNVNIEFNNSIDDYVDFVEQINVKPLVQKIKRKNGLALSGAAIYEFVKENNTSDYCNLCLFTKGLTKLCMAPSNRMLEKFGLFIVESIRTMFDSFMLQNSVETNRLNFIDETVANCQNKGEQVELEKPATQPTPSDELEKDKDAADGAVDAEDTYDTYEAMANDIDAEFDTDDHMD